MNKEKSKLMKNNPKGITLIALIITVVVMLILAGVAISAIVDGTGLFSKTREAKTVYENGVAKEEALLSQIIHSNYWYSEDGFDEVAGINPPDVSKLPSETTKYVTWTWSETNQVYNEDPLAETQPANWYNYDEGKWANIKSTANNLEAYWVWIPRFAYRLPESTIATEIEVAFIKGNSKIAVLGDGTEVECYFPNEHAITNGGTGLYSDATDLAKGTNGNEKAWIIHPAFTFGDTQLNGIWVAKYEASSTNPSATNGGDNVTNLQVQVKPNVASWRGIQLANAFTVSQNMVNSDGVVNSSAVDTHLMKNTEWGAVAILSQSKYGVFNPNSTNNGQIWNNPNSSFHTGHAGNEVNAGNQSNTNNYNTANGVKASTAGTVYGVYDMAAGAHEYVMTFMLSNNKKDYLVGQTTSSNSGFQGTTLEDNATIAGKGIPDRKYYDLYEYVNSASNYTKGKIGDVTAELQPAKVEEYYRTWNFDVANFPSTSLNFFMRGGLYNSMNGSSGIFDFHNLNGSRNNYISFRPVLVIE